MSFYIGLSYRTNNEPNRKLRADFLSAEGKRILALLKGSPLKDDIAINETGRPFFPAGSGDFNISHSGSIAAVSLVEGESRRTGCDIELVRSGVNMKEIANEFFTLPEREYIFSRDEFAENRFFEIWTLKECFLKLRGLSVFDMADLPSFIAGDNSGRNRFTFNMTVSSPLSFYLYELSGDEHYLLAAAIEGSIQIQPEIRWFSQSFLPCKNIAEIKAVLNPASTVSPKM